MEWKFKFGMIPTHQQLFPLQASSFYNVLSKNIYYVQSADSNMIIALSPLSVVQLQVTQVTMEYLIWFCNYMAMHTDSTVHFYALDMILVNHSDASYLSETKARRKSRGDF